MLRHDFPIFFPAPAHSRPRRRWPPPWAEFSPLPAENVRSVLDHKLNVPSIHKRPTSKLVSDFDLFPLSFPRGSGTTAIQSQVCAFSVLYGLLGRFVVIPKHASNVFRKNNKKQKNRNQVAFRFFFVIFWWSFLGWGPLVAKINGNS